MDSKFPRGQSRLSLVKPEAQCPWKASKRKAELEHNDDSLDGICSSKRILVPVVVIAEAEAANAKGTQGADALEQN